MGELVDATMVGVGFTTNCTVAVDVHPNAVAPVNVYTVLAAGLTVVFAAVDPPGNHV